MIQRYIEKKVLDWGKSKTAGMFRGYMKGKTEKKMNLTYKICVV